MIDIDVPWPRATDAKAAETAIENCCEAAGLNVSLKGTFAKYPGSVHWHYRRAKVSGTIEITLWPAEHRMWISIQDGRRAPWIDEMLPMLRESLARALRSK